MMEVGVEIWKPKKVQPSNHQKAFWSKAMLCVRKISIFVKPYKPQSLANCHTYVHSQQSGVPVDEVGSSAY